MFDIRRSSFRTLRYLHTTILERARRSPDAVKHKKKERFSTPTALSVLG